MQRTLAELMQRRRSVKKVNCPVCSIELSSQSIAEKNAHVELCLSGQQIGIEREQMIFSKTETGTVCEIIEQESSKIEYIEIGDDSDGSEEDRKAIKSEDTLKPDKSPLPATDISQVSVKPTEELKQETDETKAMARPRKTRSSKTRQSLTSSPRKKQRKGASTRPSPPEFKVIPLSTPLAVDSFQYVSTTPFHLLSHFHSDHYIGLSKSWFDTSGASLVACTEVTSRLLLARFGSKNGDDGELTLGKDNVCSLLVLPYDVWTKVPETSLEIMAWDANHCPGAGIFLIRDESKVVLHCGDFRVNKDMIAKLSEWELDACYLDTTYLNPNYTFPKQELVINTTSQWVNNWIKEYKPKQSRILDFFQSAKRGAIEAATGTNSVLVAVGTYSIGKERLALGIAQMLNTFIYCSPAQMKTLSHYEWPELLSRLRSDSPEKCGVHLVPMRKLKMNEMIKYLNGLPFKSVLVVHPTGWTHGWTSSPQKQTLADIVEMDSNCMRDELVDNLNRAVKKSYHHYAKIQVPYSEHSSFRELFYFVNLVKCGKWLPTVNVHNSEQPVLIEKFRQFSKLNLDDF